MQAVPTYRIAPKEEYRAPIKPRLVRASEVDGDRDSAREQRSASAQRQPVDEPLQHLLGYGYGYSTAVVIGDVDRDTVITVETLIYSLIDKLRARQRNAESKTLRNSSDLVGKSAKEVRAG
jgi:hypothetical protein